MEKIFDLFRQIPIKEIGKYVTIKETMLREEKEIPVYVRTF